MWTLRGIALVLAVVVTACTESPTWSSPPPDQRQGQGQAGTPTFDLSPFVGVWHLTLRVTNVEGGGGCVADTMKSQIGVPSDYSLTITDKRVTITNPSGDYACTFSNFKTDSNSLTTFETTGYFTCERGTLPFRCNDGTTHELFSFAQDITARLSGTEISGVWGSDFEELIAGDYSGNGAQIATEFKGSR